MTNIKDIQKFVDHQVSIWGQDYVDDLFDRGFVPVETTASGQGDFAGWRWIYVTSNEYSNYITSVTTNPR